MTGYSIRLEPRSAWISPWHADTLFGSLAWAWRDLGGAEALRELLDRFDSGPPPFVVSDAFPNDLLPFPAGARAVRNEGSKAKPAWVTRAEFERFATGESATLQPAESPVESWNRLHASLGRLTDSTEGGRLYEMDAQVFKEGPGHLTLYFRCQENCLEAFLAAMEIVACRGFGKKASSGWGAFSIAGPPEVCEWLDRPQSDGFIALSHFVPSEDDPTDGAWRVHVKYPKFQANRVQFAFKGALLTLQPGAVFRSSSPREWYGRMLNLENPVMPAALQYGLALAAPLLLPAEWKAMRVE